MGFFCLFCLPLSGEVKSKLPRHVIKKMGRFSTESRSLLAAKRLSVQNKILLSVAGKPISLLDLLCKLDESFEEQFPEQRNQVPIRYQYYRARWPIALRDLEQEALFLKEAEQRKIQVSPDEIHEMMREKFGFAVRKNLALWGKSYHKAAQSIQRELLISYAMQFVIAQAMQSVTPEDVLAYYRENADRLIREESWDYQVLTFIVPTREEAEAIQESLSSGQWDGERGFSHIPESFLSSKKTLSPLYSLERSSISQKHYEEIRRMKEGEFSSLLEEQFVEGESRYSISLFYLHKYSPQEQLSLSETEDQLRNELIYAAQQREQASYLEELYQKFPVRRFSEEEDLMQYILMR